MDNQINDVNNDSKCLRCSSLDTKVINQCNSILVYFCISF